MPPRPPSLMGIFHSHLLFPFSSQMSFPKPFWSHPVPSIYVTHALTSHSLIKPSRPRLLPRPLPTHLFHASLPAHQPHSASLCLTSSNSSTSFTILHLLIYPLSTTVPLLCSPPFPILGCYTLAIFLFLILLFSSSQHPTFAIHSSHVFSSLILLSYTLNPASLPLWIHLLMMLLPSPFTLPPSPNHYTQQPSSTSPPPFTLHPCLQHSTLPPT